jgi:hypothetical protein
MPWNPFAKKSPETAPAPTGRVDAFEAARRRATQKNPARSMGGPITYDAKSAAAVVAAQTAAAAAASAAKRKADAAAALPILEGAKAKYSSDALGAMADISYAPQGNVFLSGLKDMVFKSRTYGGEGDLAQSGQFETVLDATIAEAKAASSEVGGRRRGRGRKTVRRGAKKSKKTRSRRH